VIRFKLSELVEQYEIDVLFHSQWLTAVKACQLLKEGKVKQVNIAIHGRELVFNPYKSIPFLRERYRAKMRYVFNYCSHIFSNSHFTANTLNRLELVVPFQDRTTITQLGVDPDNYTPQSKADAFAWFNIDKAHLHKSIVLNLARLIHRKGADLTLRALARIKSQHPDFPFYFLLAGDGPFKPELERLTKELGLQADVQFMGGISTQHVGHILNASDVFVMPSRSNENDFEGYGIVYLEAALASIPGIGCNSGGIPDAIIDGKTGFLVEEENVEELAEKLYLLLSNQELRQQIGNQAKERASKMSWKNISSLIATKMEMLNAS
jgi:phosphatidylinositol alpha-1,6-mannosyltransferase